MQVQKARHGYKLVKSLFGKYEEIPVDWELKKLEQISVINPEQITENYKQNEIKYIDISSIENYRIIKYEKIKLGERPSRAQRITHQNDVLVSMVRPYLHGFAKVLDNDKNLICSTGFAVIRSKSIEDVNFIFNYVKSHLFEKNFIRQMEGMAYPAITSSVVSESLIPVSNNMIEREKIGEILSNVDALIDQTQKIIEQTQKLKKGLMQKLLTRGIGHTKFKKIKWLFGKEIEIPVEWKIRHLEDGAEIKGRVGWKGYTQEDFVEKGLGAISLGANNISKENKLDLSELTYVTWSKYDESPEIQVSKNDIILAQRGSIGKVAIIEHELDKTTINPNVVLIKNLDFDNYFLYYILTSENITKQMNSITSSTTIPLLTQGQIKKFKIPVLDKSEQQKIASILSNVDSQITKQQEYKSKLESLKKGLMQKLLTGQIRVKV